jgi:hypothetical protein
MEQKLIQLPENIIQFNVDIPLDNNTGLEYTSDTYEYKLIDHFCNGKLLTNMDEFIAVRQEFQELGKYTQATVNLNSSSSYIKFWQREQDRCVNGYHTGYDYIPGYLYWYWNYTPILQSKEISKNSITGKVRAERRSDFPLIYDGDYYWFHYVEEAEKRGQHCGCIKSRGKGYSFKAASMMTRNFYLIPESKSYAIANDWGFLTKKDAILTKVSDHMSFVDEHTEWFKRRQYKDIAENRRASFKEYLDGGKVIESGYKSEIIGISLGGDPNKSRGIRGKLIVWEESGSNPILKESWQIARSSVEEDGEVFGTMITFGTGGEIGEGFAGLEKLTRDPELFNIYGIPNIWEKGRINQKVCYVVPDYVNKKGFTDINGNTNIIPAIQTEVINREVLKRDPSMLRQQMAEHPLNIEEAVMKVEGSPFDIKLIGEQLAELKTNPMYRNTERYGFMNIDGKGNVFFKEDDNAIPLLDFPTKDKKPDGCIILYEDVYMDKNGKIPDMLYVAGTDPVDLGRDDVGDTFSLASTFVMNRVTKRIVAEYTGRPSDVNTYYEQLRRLLLYYKCQTLFEANLVGLFRYFERMNSVHLLANTPELWKDKFNYKGLANNKGIKSDSQGQVKAWCRKLIQSYMAEPLDIIEDETDEDDKNNVKENLTRTHRIRGIALLQELKDWIKEGNFDRVDAFGYTLLYMEECIKVEVTKDTSRINPIVSDMEWVRMLGKGRKRHRISLD